VNGNKIPLGRQTDYPQKYSPELLCPIPRSDSRQHLCIPHRLPFSGIDIWNAWELTWLDAGGKPAVATVHIEVPAESANLVESKSLKLYFGSFTMTEFDHATDVLRAIERDVSDCVGAPVVVDFNADVAICGLDGQCIDALDVTCVAFDIDANLLAADPATEVRECLHTHLLRSLCPVTAQPDVGSLMVSYSGPRIDPESLLRYVVSFRNHNDFHEACVERMFMDIMERLEPARLTIQAFYQRRGGIDINPFRTNCGDPPKKLRLWRQ
jgi:7-cyano-7-deazaguanine reductase